MLPSDTPIDSVDGLLLDVTEASEDGDDDRDGVDEPTATADGLVDNDGDDDKDGRGEDPMVGRPEGSVDVDVLTVGISDGAFEIEGLSELEGEEDESPNEVVDGELLSDGNPEGLVELEGTIAGRSEGTSVPVGAMTLPPSVQAMLQA